jgi:hypothetical protein
MDNACFRVFSMRPTLWCHGPPGDDSKVRPTELGNVLKKLKKVVAAASFIVAEVQVKYEKYDWFMPTSLRPPGHC